MRALAIFGCLLFAAGCYHFDDDLNFCRTEGRCRDGGAEGGGEGGGTGSDAGGGTGGGTGGGGGAVDVDAGELCAPTIYDTPFQPLVCNSVGYCWEHPYPTGVHLNVVAPLSACDAWVAGYGSTALHYQNGRWSVDTTLMQDLSIASESLYALAPNASGQLYAGGSTGSIYELGTGNSQPPIAPNAGLTAMRLRDDGRLVAVGTSFKSKTAGMILEQDDAGVFQWVYGSDDDPEGVFFDVTPGGAGTMTAGGNIAARWEGPDAGWTFVDGGEKPPFTADSLWRAANGTLWAVVEGNAAWHAAPPDDQWHLVGTWLNQGLFVTGSGNTAYIVNGRDVWTCKAAINNACAKIAKDVVQIPTVPYYALRQQWLADVEIAGDGLWMVGDYGTFAKGSVSHPDAGIRNLTPSPREQLNALYIGPSGDEWAVGKFGTVLRRDPQQGWVQVPAPTLEDLFSVTRTATGELVIVGNAAALQLQGDGGLSAIDVYENDGGTETLDFAINAISTGGGRTFAAGKGGRIFEWTGGKLQEIPPAQESPQDVEDLFVTNAGTAWAVGDVGTVRYFDGGTWASRAAVGTADLWRVWVNGTDDVYALTTGSPNVRHFTGFTGAASTMTTGLTSNAVGISGTGATDIWVVGDEEVGHYGSTGWDPVDNPHTVTTFGAVKMRGATPVIAGEGGAILTKP